MMVLQATLEIEGAESLLQQAKSELQAQHHTVHRLLAGLVEENGDVVTPVTFAREVDGFCAMVVNVCSAATDFVTKCYRDKRQQTDGRRNPPRGFSDDLHQNTTFEESRPYLSTVLMVDVNDEPARFPFTEAVRRLRTALGRVEMAIGGTRDQSAAPSTSSLSSRASSLARTSHGGLSLPPTPGLPSLSSSSSRAATPAPRAALSSRPPATKGVRRG